MTLPEQTERLQRCANLDAPAAQDAEQRAERDRVLASGNHVSIRPFPPAADRMRLDVEEVGEPALALACRVRQQRVGAFRLIRDDVAQRPATAAPGVREIPRPLARIVAALARLQPIERDIDRRREVGAGRLRENAHPAVVMLVGAGRRPGVVGRVDRDPRLALTGELPGHRGPQGVDAVDQQRIDVGLDRIEIGRKKQPGAVRIHLVNVVHNLRVPDVVERIDGQLGFDLGERVPVPVVVVTGVVMVQLRRRRPFGAGAERVVIPLGDDGHAVGIQ